MHLNDRRTRAVLMGHPEWVRLPHSKTGAIHKQEEFYYTGQPLTCRHSFAPQHVEDGLCVKCHERAVEAAKQWPDMTEANVVRFLRDYVQARFTTDEGLLHDGMVIERNGELLFLFKVFAAEARVKMRGETSFVRRTLDTIPVRRDFNTFVLGKQCRPYAVTREALGKKVASVDA